MEADVLLRGVRVIDPESGLDAVRDVAITGRRIVAVAPQANGDRPDWTVAEPSMRRPEAGSGRQGSSQ